MTKLSILFVPAVLALAAIGGAQEQSALERLDPALDTIVSRDAKVEKLPDSPGAGTREGPVWVRNGGYLLYSATVAGTINKWDPRDGEVSTFMENAHSDGLTIDREGRIAWASGRGQVVRIEKDGRRTVLASEYEGKALNAPNDLVYKSDGALYFSDPLPLTPGYNDPNAPAKGVPSVYLLKDGKLQLLTKDISRPNGLAFSPDERYLYINNSFQMTILRFDVRPDDTIANGRLFIDENADKKHPFPGCASPDVCPGDGYPDGMKVDQKGNVYCTGPGGIWVVSPEGKHIGTILVPGRPANLGFGGEDGATLFITSRPGLYRIRLKVAGIRP